MVFKNKNKQNLEELQKYAAFGKISSGILHDVSNLLTVIFSRVEGLTENSKCCKKFSKHEDIVKIKTTLEKIRILFSVKLLW